MVDAVNGEVLHRENQVENSSDAFPFTGATTDTECGPKHQFATTDGNTRSITLVAGAANSLNDIVVKLYRGDTLLGSGDLGTSPETLVYSPGGTIPQDTYAAQVCPFDSPTAPLLPPYDYALSVVTSDEEAGGGGGAPTHAPRWRFFPANPTLDSATPDAAQLADRLLVRPDPRLHPPDRRAEQRLGLRPVGHHHGHRHDRRPPPPATTPTPTRPGRARSPRAAPPRRRSRRPADYTTQFTDAWNNSKCDPAQLVPGGNDIDGRR